MLAIVRGVLFSCLQAFAVPGTPPTFYRRFLPLIVLVVALVGGYFVWTVGTDALVRAVSGWVGKPPKADSNPGVHAALVVAWLALIGFTLTLLNLVVPALRRQPLVFVVPVRLYSWLSGMAAVGVGLLIGTSIFR